MTSWISSLSGRPAAVSPAKVERAEYRPLIVQDQHSLNPNEGAEAVFAESEGSLRISGRLDANTLTTLWHRAMSLAKQRPEACIDAAAVSYCDGAGVALLVALVKSGGGGAREVKGLSPELERLLKAATPEGPVPLPSPPQGLIEQVGAATASIARDIYNLIAFLGEVVLAAGWAATHPHRVRWKDVLLVCEKAGANATPVVCLLGGLMGLIISFQSVRPLRDLGVESTIPTLLAVSMVRELGPLVTAIVLAGRSGSAFAAEIGTMKVTEEISALTTFGLDPSRFLVVPRMLGAMLMTPLLSVFCTLMGLVGGFVVMATLGYGIQMYVTQVIDSVNYVDFLQGLFKSIVFAFLVAGVGCQKGLATANGPGAVGDSTTRAVVAGIVLVVAADGILGVVFFYLGI